MTNTFSIEGSAALTDLGLIRAQGADAAAFLHGQLTNDFSALDLAHARLAGYCSAKGRLLASFVGYKVDEQVLHLICSQDLLSATLKRLSMFVMRSRCSLQDASADFELKGLAGAQAVAALGGAAPSEVWGKSQTDAGHHVVRLPDAGSTPRFLWVAAKPAQPPALTPMDLNTWHLGEVQSAVARVQSIHADHFVPQMLNYELVGGVDFKKGCYPGQEVVARSQYRGTIKRRSLLFSCDAPAYPGQAIFHTEDPAQPAGRVVHGARQPEHKTLLLAEVKWAALSAGQLRLGSAQGAVLEPCPMPYKIDAPAL